MVSVFLACPTAGPENNEWLRYANVACSELSVSCQATSYENCDGIFALLPPGTLSLGVPIAIGYGYARFIPTAIVFDHASRHLDFHADHVRCFPHREMYAAAHWLKGMLA